MTVLDPKVYMANQVAGNQLAEIQRTNQARKNFQNFTPDEKSGYAGLKLGAQPNTVFGPATKAGSGGGPGLQEYLDRKAAEENEERIKASIILNPSSEGANDTLQSISNYDESYNYRTNKYKPLIGLGGEQGRLDLQGNPANFWDWLTNNYSKTGPQQGGQPISSMPFNPRTTGDASTDATINELTLANIAPSTMKDTIKAGLDVGGKSAPRPAPYGAEVFQVRQSDGSYASGKQIVGQKDADGNTIGLAAAMTGVQPGAMSTPTFVPTGKNADGEANTFNVEKDTPEKILNTFQNVTPKAANRMTQEAITARDDVVRLANIAKSEGNRKEFELQKAKLRALDMGIILAQGNQGIEDIKDGDTRRLSAVLSDATGSNIQIVPRDDNLFNVIVDGKIRDEKGETAESIGQKAKLVFDNKYKAQMTTIAVERSNLEHKAQLIITQKMMADTAEMERVVAKANGEYRVALLKDGSWKSEDVKLQDGTEISVLVRGDALATIKTEEGLNEKGDAVIYTRLVPFSGGNDYSGSSYKAAQQ
tara:strand:+ start:821 stop:2425 length:1605 start_codon:yes stop_codon:yes gene_type:complete